MKLSSWCRSAVVLAACLTADGLALTAQGQGRAPLFVETSEPPRANLAARDRRARRARRLRISTPALAGLMRRDVAARATQDVNLFPDVVLTVVRERLETGRLGHTSWVGHVAGDPESTVSLTWDGRVLSGGVVTGGRAYDVAPDTDGTVTVVERGADPPAPELPSLEPPASRAAEAYVQDLAADGSTAAIDLLILYTPSARANAGGLAQIESQLVNAVAVTNAAFQRSGVNAVMTAVGVQELAYVEREFLRDDLDAISVGGAANPAVEALRSATGADLVALITGRPATSSGCGIAWLGPSSAYPFSATEQVCLYAGQWSLTHELGHNFGARHAPGDTSDTTPTCGSYACGYREGTIRTLMAYYVSGFAPSRVLNYSSATILEPAGSGVPTGNSLQNNARQISETAGTVATYRASEPPLSLPGVPRQFSATVAGNVVTMSWLPPSSGGAVTGYELEAGSTHGAANVLSTTVTGPTLSIGGVGPGTYYARLRSVNPAGRSVPTPDLAVVVGGCTAPGPIVLSANRSGNVVSLTWTTPAGTAPFSFTLGAGSAPGAIDRGILPMGGVTTYNVTPPPGVYYVKAIATNACGNGPISNEVAVTVP
jgi:hypothetical protein